MNQQQGQSDRRDFMKYAGAASAVAALGVPRVFASAGVNQHCQIALIGCGGSGTGAVGAALTAATASTTHPATAERFQHRLDESYNALEQQYQGSPELIRVPEEKKFVGFDA